jgi:hypothetical protein
MNKTSILLAMGLAALALSLTLVPTGLAGQQVGDNFTIIVPAGKITDLKKLLVVTGKPKATATKVGNCAKGAVYFSDANLVDREGKAAPVATETTIAFPGAAGFAELKPGWRIGSFRPGGKCGPGYEAFVAHIIAME